jgi:glycosyltransferase involved in cell wall biosynthesis
MRGDRSMTAESLLVIKDAAPVNDRAGLTIDFEEVKRRVRDRSILRDLGSNRDVVLRTHSLAHLSRPFATAGLLRLMGRRSCVLEDEQGTRIRVTPGLLVRWGVRALRDKVATRGLLRRVTARVDALAQPRLRPRLGQLTAPVYLRTDLWFGVQSGGSVGHVAGVLNQLADLGDARFLTTDRIPMVAPAVETLLLDAGNRFWDQPDLTAIGANEPILVSARRHLSNIQAGMIYQRYSVANVLGLELSRERSIPFVLEYNGSEVWINRNWGRPLKYEALAERIELANLRGADLVVVVSEPMKVELVARGIDPAAILVNPNGVDTDAYSSAVDGSAIRERFGLADKTVIGFIGTFGPWHGAEVLAEAYGRLLARRPELRDTTRLFMIGDGLRLEATRQRLAEERAAANALFAGRTAQADGPAHLAACDILVSPHVPNPDGTPFFGSPTKLFEYMAMGKPIVASDLDQIGEVLEHDRTAWLVRPGDADSLAAGIETLLDDPDRAARLGQAARERAVEAHTWRAHVERIIEALRERCA